MAIEDLWYKNAIIYCLNMEKYQDANGDGIGDFEGLSRRLDFLNGLGVNCIWLQPFYPSPLRDNGYDIRDYYGVNSRYGSLGDFVEFMNHARALGMRVILDLVVNHTSVDHPWFQSARKDPDSPFRDWYVWSETRPKDHASGIVFPGVQKSTWTKDKEAKLFYFHRFYEHQADLNTHNPAVRDEINKIMGFWLELGISGFRMDAVPFMIEKKGLGVKPGDQDFEMLHDMRDFLQWRRRDAIMLAEANVPPDQSLDYFGEQGDRIQMMLNFPVNQRLFYALATADTRPLRWALQETAKLPHSAQWVQFLRSHDELDLGRLTEEQREKVFKAFAPDPDMQLYNRGIRRRLAPMLGNDRRHLELAWSLLFSLPGTPMIQYGDEIGIGDNLELKERECARTPMQWSAEKHGGFSLSDTVVAPVNDDREYGYKKLNADAQRRDPESFLNWVERLIRMRRECPEISWGKLEILDPGTEQVLALRYEWRNTSLLTIHNFGDRPKRVMLDPKSKDGAKLVDVFGTQHSRSGSDGRHEIRLPARGWRWYRLGASDNVLARAPF